MKTLRLILGDQLNIQHSWFKNVEENTTYCLFEMRQETDYVVHHIQKVIGFFAAMRHFSEDLKSLGHKVIYWKLNDEDNTQDLSENLKKLIKKHQIERFEYLLPDEFRLDEQLNTFCSSLSIETQAYSTEHFYTSRYELKDFFKGKKQFLMESFYRYMRKKHGILMTANQPKGGSWNYDKSNRKSWNGKPDIPNYKYFENEVNDILQDINKAEIKTIGSFTTKTFPYPITRKQALEQLKFFCEELLESFGDYQDAMNTKEVNLFHSRLSFAMNLKLISPRNVIDTTLNYYRKNSDKIHISQVEGFIRQILGWREYMRGMYWLQMPNFKKDNYFNNSNKLADFFWTGNTKMNCLKHAITNTLENAYAHHIQRLMITGNYALLTQTNPDDIDTWYLGIYADAIEWVQLPNTRGMSQYADGGKIATKPYISSASYIDKMSNYCEGCYYDKNKKTEDNACPFNSLYWNFLDDKRKTLENNRRMKLMYSILDKMNNEQMLAIKEKAYRIMKNQNNL